MIQANEKGITLPEVLAGIVIAAIIGTLAYGILFTGLQTNERVKAEAQLRDEADLIMTWFIQDLYTLKLSDVKNTYLPDDTNTNNYFIETHSGKKLGFINGNAQRLNGEIIQVSDDASLEGSKIEEIATGQFKITLVVQNGKSGEKIELISEIGIIRDH